MSKQIKKTKFLILLLVSSFSVFLLGLFNKSSSNLLISRNNSNLFFEEAFADVPPTGDGSAGSAGGDGAGCSGAGGSGAGGCSAGDGSSGI